MDMWNKFDRIVKHCIRQIEQWAIKNVSPRNDALARSSSFLFCPVWTDRNVNTTSEFYCRLLQGSFLGRLRHFIDIIDPSTLFVSEVRPALFLCRSEIREHYTVFVVSNVCKHIRNDQISSDHVITFGWNTWWIFGIINLIYQNWFGLWIDRPLLYEMQWNKVK